MKNTGLTFAARVPACVYTYVLSVLARVRVYLREYESSRHRVGAIEKKSGIRSATRRHGRWHGRTGGPKSGEDNKRT